MHVVFILRGSSQCNRGGQIIEERRDLRKQPRAKEWRQLSRSQRQGSRFSPRASKRTQSCGHYLELLTLGTVKMINLYCCKATCFSVRCYCSNRKLTLDPSSSHSWEITYVSLTTLVGNQWKKLFLRKIWYLKNAVKNHRNWIWLCFHKIFYPVMIYSK